MAHSISVWGPFLLLWYGLEHGQVQGLLWYGLEHGQVQGLLWYGLEHGQVQGDDI